MEFFAWHHDLSAFLSEAIEQETRSILSVDGGGEVTDTILFFYPAERK